MLNVGPACNIAGMSDRTFFVTTVAWQRRSLFRCETTARLLVQTLYHYREQKKFLLHEFVIMPDHVHLLLTPAKEISLERAVQFIKGGFSFRLQSRFPVWQASFTNHRIRDANDYERHRGYIRENAVRAGLVRTAKDYPFCSGQGTFEIDPPPLTISTECV